MKFALQGSMVERASNRIVEGGERSEVTELLTFLRARGGKLAAFSHPADLTLPHTSSLVQTNIGVNEPADSSGVAKDGHSLKDGRNLCARMRFARHLIVEQYASLLGDATSEPGVAHGAS